MITGAVPLGRQEPDAPQFSAEVIYALQSDLLQASETALATKQHLARAEQLLLAALREGRS